ncbi:STAS domain-containing protein [Actinoplanes sp. LDG1-06]|uniref:Anti-sigma factor antagonist n=1 Tax=Paractinoplanes ovalisporus TaxID=2810368 RepID=A0ABS2ANF3_9ACTN|nr:STAS domain-containing protein [Actinoplanes ovalisporus]MBM2621335.1 STAS domain-containing protein [Actinoplanes ovalisporus]
MGRFEAKTDEHAGHVRVTLAGDCDLAVRDQLHTVLADALGSSPVVVVDLGAVEFLDSSGVHALIVAHHAARARGGRVTVVNATGAVASVLDITGVAELLGPQDVPAPPEQARADG